MTQGQQTGTKTDFVGANLRRKDEGASLGRRRGWLGLGLSLALTGLAVGCHKTPAQNPAVAQMDQNAGDPADANLAPVSGNGSYAPARPARVLAQNVQYQSQQRGEDYAPQGAPIERRSADGQVYSAPGDAGYGAQNSDPNYDDGQYDMQQAQDAYAADLTDAEATEPPPPLPEYEQPPAPEPDYLWTPGYWAWTDGGYYWVPGSWVAAPYAGALWTPGYWGYVGNRYRFHHGFWGLHIGFYGGVDYGYGYVGHGYYGGYWDRGHFRYNTAVNRVNVNVVRNVYVHNVVINNVVVNNRIVNRVSYAGGRGGLNARPMAAEIAVLHEERRAPMAAQIQVQHQAAQNRAQFYTQNHGRPAVAVNVRAVVADRAPLAVLPRVNVPAGRGAGWQGNRPGSQVQPGRPVQPGSQVQPTNQERPGNQMQGGWRGVQPGQPQSQMRPGTPQVQEQQHGGQVPQQGQAPQGWQQRQQQDQHGGQVPQGWQQRQQQLNHAAPQAGQPQVQHGPVQENRQGPQQPGAQPAQPQQPQQPQQRWQQRQGWQQRQNEVRPSAPQPQQVAPQPQPRPMQPQMQQRAPQPEVRPSPQPDMRQQQQREFRQSQPQPAAPVQPRPQEQARPQPQAPPQHMQHMGPPPHMEQHAAPPPHGPEQPHRDDRDHH